MSALIPINNVNVAFEVVGDEIFANSLQIAEVFEKNHSHILRTIDNLPNDEFKSSNFKYDSYFDKKGEQRRMINLTRDGFSLLVMGFTGEKAYRWKVEFIKAFNMMEAELKRLSVCRYVDKISQLEADFKLKSERHQDQINGYKGQIAKHNNQIELLKAQLAVKRPEVIYQAEVIENYEAKAESLRAMLHNARCERDYYFKRFNDLKKERRYKEEEIVRLLNKIRVQMDGVYAEIGAVMSYCHDDDRYFIENQNLKDAR